ncbi:MAG: polysaccharide pyruvyl transferase family protein [Porcipelethomonas sp.]
MKRFYFRGGELPFQYITPERAMYRNILGGNSGNLLYQYGILKAIMTSKNDELVCNWYKPFRFSPEYINENFDYFIIPLADAFRESFIDELEDLTKLVQNLKIPCIVTGVGLRNPYEPDFKHREYKFDNSVKKFIKAILEKSAIVGVRGQITGDYLKHLGFIEDKHYMIIGCPSMFSNGCNLSVRDFKFDYNMNICINAVNTESHIINNFVNYSIKKFENWFFIGQLITELKLIYIGLPHEAYGCNFPCESILSEVHRKKM